MPTIRQPSGPPASPDPDRVGSAGTPVRSWPVGFRSAPRLSSGPGRAGQNEGIANNGSLGFDWMSSPFSVLATTRPRRANNLVASRFVAKSAQRYECLIRRLPI